MKREPFCILLNIVGGGDIDIEPDPISGGGYPLKVCIYSVFNRLRPLTSNNKSYVNYTQGISVVIGYAAPLLSCLLCLAC